MVDEDMAQEYDEMDDETVFTFRLSRGEVKDMLQDNDAEFDEYSFDGLDEILYDRAWSWVCSRIY